MTVSARDLPESRRRRRIFHVVAGLAAALAVWSVSTWSGRARTALARVATARERVEADRSAADGVAAECGLRPFSDEKSLQRFPMERPPFPTRRESECLKKVTQARSALINDRLDLDKAVPVAEDVGAVAKRRVMIAAVFLTIFLAGVYVTELHPMMRAAFRGRGA